jgi:DNA adenine methylase
VVAGGKLYLDTMTEKKHQKLADFLATETLDHWLLTYDQAPMIHELYQFAAVDDMEVVYSLQKKRKQKEYLIYPHPIS